VSDVDVSVTVSKRRGCETEDREYRIKNLQELFDVCRKVGPSEVVRVSLQTREGEVRLHFASFIRKP
jgi:hypothetical protein